MKIDDLQDVKERKRQFEEDIKMARLTGISKNTFRGSANSLSYSPSPKRASPSAEQVKSSPDLKESPI